MFVRSSETATAGLASCDSMPLEMHLAIQPKGSAAVHCMLCQDSRSHNFFNGQDSVHTCAWHLPVSWMMTVHWSWLSSGPFLPGLGPPCPLPSPPTGKPPKLWADLWGLVADCPLNSLHRQEVVLHWQHHVSFCNRLLLLMVICRNSAVCVNFTILTVHIHTHLQVWCRPVSLTTLHKQLAVQPSCMHICCRRQKDAKWSHPYLHH